MIGCDEEPYQIRIWGHRRNVGIIGGKDGGLWNVGAQRQRSVRIWDV